MTAETVVKEMAENVTEEEAETEIVSVKPAETEEAVAEVPAETVAKEMAENVTEEEAETEIVSVKPAETKGVVKCGKFSGYPGGFPPKKIKTWS